MKNSRNLILGEVIYIFIIYHIPFSWLNYFIEGLHCTIFRFDHDRWKPAIPGWSKELEAAESAPWRVRHLSCSWKPHNCQLSEWASSPLWCDWGRGKQAAFHRTGYAIYQGKIARKGKCFFLHAFACNKILTISRGLTQSGCLWSSSTWTWRWTAKFSPSPSMWQLLLHWPITAQLHNLVHRCMGAMVALDTYSDNLCLWHCIDVHQEAQHDEYADD